MEIALTADIAVVQGLVVGRLVEESAIKSVLEDRTDRGDGASLDEDAASTGCIDARIVSERGVFATMGDSTKLRSKELARITRASRDEIAREQQADLLAFVDRNREIVELPPGLENGQTRKRLRGARTDSDCIDEICEIVAQGITATAIFIDKCEHVSLEHHYFPHRLLLGPGGKNAGCTNRPISQSAPTSELPTEAAPYRLSSCSLGTMSVPG